jgi:hypothetical protein
MCRRWTGRGAPAGAADRGQGHPERAWPGEVPAAVLQQALADLNAAYRNIFVSVAGRQKMPRPAAPGSGPAKDHRQAIRFTANARFKVLTSGEAAPAQDRGRASSHRWLDQRISPGRMTWTRFSARTGSKTVSRFEAVTSPSGVTHLTLSRR